DDHALGSARFFFYARLHARLPPVRVDASGRAHNDVGVLFRAAAELFGGTCVARPAASAPWVECTEQHDPLEDRLAARSRYSAAASRWHAPLKRCRRGSRRRGNCPGFWRWKSMKINNIPIR